MLKQSQSAEETGDGSKYQWRVYTNENNIEMSLLHIAAERNLDSIAEILVDEYPNLLYLKTDCSGSEDASDQGKMPIELALGSEKNIDVSALLIGRMSEER